MSATHVLIVVAELIIKVSLVLGVAVAAAKWTRVSAAFRHNVLFSALLCAAVIPLAAAALAAFDLSLRMPVDALPLADGQPLRSPAEQADVPANVARVLLVFWLTGALLCVGRVLLAEISLARLLSHAQQTTDPRWLCLLRESCSAMGVDQPGLLCSARIDVPFACGARHPSIVIPPSALNWTSARVREVLLHELAHIERRDALTHLIARLARAVHFWSPLAFYVERQLALARECSCDDRVLSCGQPAEAYALTLVEIASAGPSAGVVSEISIAHHTHLEQRIVALMDESRRRGRSSHTQVSFGAAAALCVSIGFGAVQTSASEQPANMPDSEVASARSSATSIQIMSMDAQAVRHVIAYPTEDGALRRVLLVDNVEQPWDEAAEQALSLALQAQATSDFRNQTELIAAPDAVSIVEPAR